MYEATTYVCTLTVDKARWADFLTALRGYEVDEEVEDEDAEFTLRENDLEAVLKRDGKYHISRDCTYYRFDEIADKIAPWVDGMIGFVGEDMELFGYRYEKGEVTYLTGNITWKKRR